MRPALILLAVVGCATQPKKTQPQDMEAMRAERLAAKERAEEARRLANAKERERLIDRYKADLARATYEEHVADAMDDVLSDSALVVENVAVRDAQAHRIASAYLEAVEGGLLIRIQPGYAPSDGIEVTRAKARTRRVVEEARAGGARVVTLEVRRENSAARSLYRKLGFVDAGLRRNYYGRGEDAIIMSWNGVGAPLPGDSSPA